MSKSSISVSANFLNKLKQRVVDQQSQQESPLDIGLLLSIGYQQQTDEETVQQVIYHSISLVSSLEDESEKSSFSNLSSEWFQKQVQIVQQSLPSNVRISGFYLKDFSYNVKERLSDVIALYARTIDSVQSEEGSPIYFINLQKDDSVPTATATTTSGSAGDSSTKSGGVVVGSLVPQGFIFENGKPRLDLTITFNEKSTISSLQEYLCVLPYNVKLKVGKNIDALIDQIENTLEESFEKNYIWKVNRKEKRVTCFLNTNIERVEVHQQKVPQDESELVEVVLSGVISGLVQTLDSVSSDKFIIDLIKKDIIEGLVTRIAFEDDESILKQSTNKKLLRRFYIVDSETNLIYSDYCENVKSIGIIDAIPSLLSNNSQFQVIDSENLEGEVKRIQVDRDAVIEVPDFIKKKQAKKEGLSNNTAVVTSDTASSSTGQSEGLFAWFFTFIAFILSLFTGSSKKEVNTK